MRGEASPHGSIRHEILSRAGAAVGVSGRNLQAGHATNVFIEPTIRTRGVLYCASASRDSIKLERVLSKGLLRKTRVTNDWIVEGMAMRAGTSSNSSTSWTQANSMGASGESAISRMPSSRHHSSVHITAWGYNVVHYMSYLHHRLSHAVFGRAVTGYLLQVHRYDNACVRLACSSLDSMHRSA